MLELTKDLIRHLNSRARGVPDNVIRFNTDIGLKAHVGCILSAPGYGTWEVINVDWSAENSNMKTSVAVKRIKTTDLMLQSIREGTSHGMARDGEGE